jgi:hypothetical protein
MAQRGQRFWVVNKIETVARTKLHCRSSTHGSLEDLTGYRKSVGVSGQKKSCAPAANPVGEKETSARDRD